MQVTLRTQEAALKKVLIECSPVEFLVIDKGLKGLLKDLECSQSDRIVAERLAKWAKTVQIVEKD